MLHYAQEIFEGLKAYRMPDGGAALFRPDANAARFRESAAAKCGGEFIDQFRRRHKAGVEAVLNGAIRDRDREMRFPTAWFTAENDAAAFRDEIRCEGGAEERESDRRLKHEIELIDRLEKRKARPLCRSQPSLVKRQIKPRGGE